jgi:hypothetical protein
MVLGLDSGRIALRRVHPEPGGGTRIEAYGVGEPVDPSRIRWASRIIAFMPRD